MQWDKVKNILIVILLAVDLFLLAGIGLRVYTDYDRAHTLRQQVETLAQQNGWTIEEGLTFPREQTLPALSIDRSRAEEERVARAMLGGQADAAEQSDSAVRYTGDAGAVIWQGDGSLQGTLPCSTGADEAAVRALLTEWGLWEENGALSVQENEVRYSAPLAGMPVHNRMLRLTFAESGTLQLSGRWCFGTPYTTAAEQTVACSAADALLAFAAAQTGGGSLQTIELGYRIEVESGRRLQLTPTWKITTDQGEFLEDCAKKTVIS